MNNKVRARAVRRALEGVIWLELQLCQPDRHLAVTAGLLGHFFADAADSPFWSAAICLQPTFRTAQPVFDHYII